MSKYRRGSQEIIYRVLQYLARSWDFSLTCSGYVLLIYVFKISLLNRMMEKRTN